MESKAVVSVIGANMIDIIGRPFNSLIPKDSNAGTVKISAGGVSRNVSETLARLGVGVHFITTIGQDALSELIVHSCQTVGIDTTHFQQLPTATSNTYLAILDESGDMSLALSDTTTIDQLSIDHLRKESSFIQQGKLIVTDASISEEVLDFMSTQFPTLPIYLDPVSIGKAKRIKRLIGKVHLLKCNRLEAEFLSDQEITCEQDYFKVANYFHSLGIEKVIITRGSKGVFYSMNQQQGFYQHRCVDVVNATGAGDAFFAGWIYSQLHDFSLELSLKFASEVAAFALESFETVSHSVTAQKVMEKINEKY